MLNETERLSELEERLLTMEERVHALRRQIIQRKGFTDNPLALDTDLDDLGAVKTYLDFDEVADPGTPPADVGRLYAKSQSTRTVLTLVDDQGNSFTLFMRQDGAAISVAEGTASVTIAAGTRISNSLLVTHNIGWVSVGRVWTTIQQATNLLDAERPVEAAVYAIGANSFAIRAVCHANVGANRTFQIAWLASGVL